MSTLGVKLNKNLSLHSPKVLSLNILWEPSLGWNMRIAWELALLDWLKIKQDPLTAKLGVHPHDMLCITIGHTSWFSSPFFAFTAWHQETTPLETMPKAVTFSSIWRWGQRFCSIFCENRVTDNYPLIFCLEQKAAPSLYLPSCIFKTISLVVLFPLILFLHRFISQTECKK